LPDPAHLAADEGDKPDCHQHAQGNGLGTPQLGQAPCQANGRHGHHGYRRNANEQHAPRHLKGRDSLPLKQKGEQGKHRADRYKNQQAFHCGGRQAKKTIEQTNG